MNSKSFGLVVLGILALVLVMGLGSAATLSNWNFDSSSIAPTTGAGTLTINTGATQSFVAGNPGTGKALSTDNWDANEFLNIALSTSGYENIILSFDEEASTTGPTSFKIQYSSDGTTFTDLTGSTTSTTLTVSSGGLGFGTTPMHTFDFSAIPAMDDKSTAKFRIVVPSTAGGATGVLHIDNLVVSGTVLPLTPSEITACNVVGNSGQLKVKKISFTNNGLETLHTTFGEDDKWFPLESVTTEIQIKNDGSNDVDNIELNWGIYNTQTNEWVVEMDNLKDFDLKDGDTKTFTVDFSIDDNLDVDLSDLTDGEDYRFYVTATGDVDSDTSPSTCASDFEAASVVVESDFVMLSNLDLPDTVECGATVDVKAEVWNVGDNDQDSVTVEVTGRESVLGVDETVDVGDVNAFDNQQVSFSFTLPRNLEEKTYSLSFVVLDEDGDVYQNDFNDDDSEYSVPLRVSGGCSPEVTVSASTVSGGEAGKELVVKSTVTNTGNTQAVYTVSVSGSNAWASSASLDQTSLVLAPGESKDVTIRFDVNKDAEGSQTFSLDLASSNGQTTSQPVVVSVKPASGFGLTGNTVLTNPAVWGMALLVLVLIVAIIVVAVRKK